MARSLEEEPRACSRFEQGCVWHMERDWVSSASARSFPNGEYDDWVDTVTQAIIWLRRTYHLQFQEEEEEVKCASGQP
jgi:phage terminase large subunit-like protein